MLSKSAHTALAVKACLLRGNSYTKCSITFVNIAVAISALAGGGCYGRLAFIWRIEYIQDLPGAARRLLDSERFEGVPVSSFQERLCTLWQGGKNI